MVTVVPRGYVAVQIDPPVWPFAAQPGPQWRTFAVPVADGAVTSQFVVFKPSLKNVSVVSSCGTVLKQEPGVGGLPLGLGRTNGHPTFAVAVAIDPLLSSISAVMTAPTAPLLASFAVTTPPFCVPAPVAPLPILLLTGYLFGSDVSHMT
jgi:hypothetical protein